MRSTQIQSRREMKKLFTVVSMVAMTAITIAQGLTTLSTFDNEEADCLVINELMQSNIDCIMDELNEFPDSWVELYNPGDQEVNLSAYKLGISDDPKEAWQLPSVTVGAKEYKLVYCDKVGSELHTDFRLESGKGCAVYLFNSGTMIDCITGLKKQPAPNVAYGRATDGDDTWGYQAVPTPGEANCGELCNKVLADPIFSELGRVITDGTQITLHVTMPDGTPKGTSLHYTIDGTEPDAMSPVFPADGIVLSETRVVRVKPFCRGYLSPRSTTQSYIFHPRAMTLPVISIVTDPKYFTDDEVGIYADNTCEDGKKNYEHDWRRPINMEFFEEAGEVGQLNQLCETRITGQTSRKFPLKSFALYAHKRFGEKRFDYELFPEDRPGKTDYKSVLLRNAGGDFPHLYMRDAVIQRSMAWHADLDFQAYRPVIYYLNGQYMGMLNLRERSNEDNLYTNYDGLEDIDMIENWKTLKTGTMDAFNAFKSFYTDPGHTWEEYAERMDLNEYINFMIMNLYFCNTDFPGNNFVMWRPRMEDGRWRFLAKDTDLGLGLRHSQGDYDIIEFMYNPDYYKPDYYMNKEPFTRLFRHLMEDSRFAREFLDRCAIYMGDFLNYDGTWQIWQPMCDAIREEYPYHSELYYEQRSWTKYEADLNKAKQWHKERTDYFYQMLADHYQTGTLRALQINTSLNDEARNAVTVVFNGVALSANRFNGKFYQGEKVVLQGSETEAGQGVVGWTVKITAADGQQTTQQIDGSTYEFLMPECQSCEINAILSSDILPKVIETILHDEDSPYQKILDVNGDGSINVSDIISLIRH